MCVCLSVCVQNISKSCEQILIIFLRKNVCILGENRLAFEEDPDSVHSSICPVWAHNSKTKKRRKIEIGVDVPHGTSKWSANFHFERSKVKVKVT